MKKPTVKKPSEASPYLRIVLHSIPGSGKTTLAADMLERPLIIQLDNDGSTPLRKTHPKVDVVKLFDPETTHQPFEDLLEYVSWAGQQEQYDGIVLDTWTSLQNRYLDVAKPKTKDARQAYGGWADYSRVLVNKLMAQPKHILILANSAIVSDLEGDDKIMPALTKGSIQSFQEEISFAFYVAKDIEEDNGVVNIKRTLFTAHPRYWTKERSGASLPPAIDISKIGTGKKLIPFIQKALSGKPEPVAAQ